MNCEKCGLHPERKLAVAIPSIDGKRVALVIDNPSMEEVQKQEVLSDGKGMLIKETLKELGVTEYCVLYACCCSDNTNRSPSSIEIKCCQDQLHQSIKIFNPDVIVPLGMLSLKAFKPDAMGIEDLRGNPFQWENYWVLPTYSAGYVLHYLDSFTLFKQDLSNAFHREVKSYRQPVIKLFTPKDDEEIFKSIEELKTSKILALDIETTGLSRYEDVIRLVGMEGDNGISYQYPFGIMYNGKYREAFRELLEEHPYIVTHNGLAFDAPFIKEQLGINCKVDLDTMLVHYLIDERRGSHNLGFVGRNFLFAPEYKSAIKDYANDPLEKLSYYLGYDTAITYDLPKVLDLTHIQKRLYDEQIHPLGLTFATMNERGALIDVEYLKSCEAHLDHQFNRLCRIIKSKTGIENINSPQQVAKYVYNVLRYPPHRKMGRTTSKDYLATFNNRILDLIVKAKEFSKLKGTYCTGILKRLDEDGRIRTSYLIHGTVSDRVSSQNPNLQNIPKGKFIKKAFPAPEGMMFVEADYSQLELRVAAWYSNEDRLIKAFNDEEDIHTKTAAFMFSKSLEEVTPDQRFAAKAINFGVLYGMGADKLAQTLKCEYKVAVEYLKNWHITYPKLSAFIKEVENFVDNNGYVDNPIGSIRRFPLITNGNRNDVHREAVNTKVQGFAGAICLRALIQLTNADMLKRGIATVLTVHDSIGCYVVYDEMFDVRLGIIRDTMENAIHSLGFDTPIKFAVDIKYGKNWGDTIKWKST